MAKSLKSTAAEVSKRLKEQFPDSECTLDFDTPEHLAIRGILSAQCTDKTVNAVTQKFFEQYPEISDIAKLSEDEIREWIKPCGLSKSKAKSVKVFCDFYENEWNKKVPNDVDELTKVPGIGRKIANLIVGELYGTPALVVDTHCKRVMYRIGLTDSTDPLKVECDLCALFAREDWIKIGHLAVDLGRTDCKAKNPSCQTCCLNDICRRRV